MARSSQTRSIERRDGVSIAELVTDDMAMGNPAYLGVQSLWTRVPHNHIAQIPFQVIGNRGLIARMRCSNHRKPNPQCRMDPAGTHDLSCASRSPCNCWLAMWTI